MARVSSSILCVACLGFVCLVPACNRSSGSGGSGGGAAVSLNEVMARNVSTVLTDASGREVIHDWVELYNPSSERVSLNGYSLSDNFNRPNKFSFPAATEIAPRGFLMVFLLNRDRCREDCDIDRQACLADSSDAADTAECEDRYRRCAEECAPAGLVADFGLSASAPAGEFIFLFRGDDLVDQIGVFNQPADTSNGRFPDADPKVGVMFTPTPGAPNVRAGVKPPRIFRHTRVPPGPDTVGEIEISIEQDLPEGGGSPEPELRVFGDFRSFTAAELAVCACRGLSEELLALPFESLTLQLESVEEGVDSSRRNANDEVAPMTVLRRTFVARLPNVDCDRRFVYRVHAEDSIGARDDCDCIVVCPRSFTVNVNEYVAQNNRLALRSFNAVGEDRGLTRPDWLEIHNFGETAIEDIGNFMLIGRDGCARQGFSRERHSLNALRGLVDGDGNLVSLPPLEPGGYLWILADDDEGAGRRSYVHPDDGSRVFSTRFALNTMGDDGFCLISPDGVQLEEVVLDFAGGVPPAPDQAVMRFPEGEGSTLSTITDCPTPGAPNQRSCDVPPTFRDPVSVEPRCPRAGDSVAVFSQVNFDQGSEVDDLSVVVDAVVDADQVLPSIEAQSIELAADQTLALPGARLYDVVVQIPGQPSGAFVEFSLTATDLRLERNPPPNFDPADASMRHDATTSPQASFRYVVDFSIGIDAPVLTEVLPGVDAPVGERPRFIEFAEVFNPSDDVLDLEGYYLTQTRNEDDPIGLARRWRFPENSTVPPGGFLVVNFQPPTPRPGEPVPVPPEYVFVDNFVLSCRAKETLHLIAPDAPGAGANCVIDAISWDLTTGVGGCRENVAVGTLCDGSFGELGVPTPGAPNSLPTLGHDSTVDGLGVVGGANGCVTGASPLLVVSTIAFIDAGLVAQFGRQGSIVEATYLIQRGDDVEERPASIRGTPVQRCRPDDPVVPDPPEGSICADPPEGYAAVALTLDVQGDVRPQLDYSLRLVDFCGDEIVMGPFSIGTDSQERPDIRINEANRAFPIDGESGRPWVELYNAGDTDADIGGMFLSDTRVNPRRGRIPDGLVVGAGEFLVLRIDSLGLSFDPSTERIRPPVGTLYLSDSTARGSCIFETFPFDFSGFAGDVSLVRTPDGVGDPQPTTRPSPGASNESDGGRFVRGDVNGDGAVNVIDVIATRVFLDGGLDTVDCLDAIDSTDDGRIDISDVVQVANVVFLRSPMPAPFPGVGFDPTPDDLGCMRE